MEGHQRGTSARAAHDPRRPSLERPSLFAGSDDNLNEADGLRSVRILSTLESQERGKGPSLRGKGTRTTAPKKSAGHGAGRASRSQGLLWALVVGGLACAGGALWWAQEGNAPAAPVAARTATRTAVDQGAVKTPAMATNTHVAAPASATKQASASTAAQPVVTPSATPLAALIETSPPAAGPSVLKITPTAATPEATATATASAPQAQASATPASRPARERKAKAPKGTTAKASGQGDTPKRKDAHKPASDRDVELLEAVMSHTERRPRH